MPRWRSLLPVAQRPPPRRREVRLLAREDQHEQVERHRRRPVLAPFQRRGEAQAERADEGPVDRERGERVSRRAARDVQLSMRSMAILHDASLSAYHHRLIAAIVYIFTALGDKFTFFTVCVQSLERAFE